MRGACCKVSFRGYAGSIIGVDEDLRGTDIWVESLEVLCRQGNSVS